MAVNNQMVRRIYTCKAKKYDTCADEFSKNQNFDIIETIDDGNCFFDTLSKAGDRHQIPSLSFTHKQLREQLVQYMLTHIDEIIPYFIMNNNNNSNYSNSNYNNYKSNNNNKDPIHRIQKLQEDGVWDNNDGDIISQVAADAFQINMNIYDVKKQKSKFFINKIQFYKNKYTPIVDILRINDGHYELLIHKSKSPKSKSPTKKNSNTPKRSTSKSPNKQNADFLSLNSMTDHEIEKSKKYTIPVLQKIVSTKLGFSDFKKMKKIEIIEMYRVLRK